MEYATFVFACSRRAGKSLRSEVPSRLKDISIYLREIANACKRRDYYVPLTREDESFLNLEGMLHSSRIQYLTLSRPTAAHHARSHDKRTAIQGRRPLGTFSKYSFFCF